MPKFKVTFKEQNGEQEYYHDEIFDAANYDNASEVALRHLKENLGGGDNDGEGHYWIDVCRSISIYGISETKDIKDNFTEEELLHIFEIVHMTSKGFGLTMQAIIHNMDISDEYMKPLMEKFQKFMNPEVKA